MSASPATVSTAQGSPAGMAFDRARLAEANINPNTGLATDYLNHFNEAIMLLDLISAMPECVEEFLEWRPLSYQDHFAASRFKERELAISAYESADPDARRSLDDVADTMNTILNATHEGLCLGLSPKGAGTLAEQATIWLKPLVMRAGAIINGKLVFKTSDAASEAPQVEIDRMFKC
jgi:hypothetical protein